VQFYYILTANSGGNRYQFLNIHQDIRKEYLMYPIKTFFLLVLFSFTSLSGKEVHHLDLPKCLNMATEKNYDMRRLKENLAESEYLLKSATNRFKTQMDLSIVAPAYNETIRRVQDSLGVYFYPIQQFSYNTELRISQPLPTDGEIFLSSEIYALEDYEIDRNTAQFTTRIGFSQPLEAFYSFNQLQSGLRTAQLNYEIRQKQFARAKLNIDYEVSQAFYGLIAALEREKIAQQTLQAQIETTELAQNKYNAGVIAEVEALQMEVDLAQELNNADIAKVERIAQENLLKQLVEIPLIDSIIVSSDLTYDIVEVDLDQAIESGLKHRLEIREKEIERELAEININRIRVRGQITGSIDAYYDLIGVSSDARNHGMPYTFNRAWQEMKQRPGNKGIALSIAIPLWDWGVSSANVQAARANYRITEYAIDNEKVQVEREIRNLVARSRSSLKRLQILERNIELAKKSFDISKDRYARGEIDSQALALDRERTSNAYFTHLQAYIEYKLLLIDLTRKTFFDFEKRKSIIEE
jgi:outer membrane protein TolC